MQTLRGAFGSGVLRLAMTTAAAVSALGLAACACPSFREWFGGRRAQPDWRGRLAGFLGGAFKVLLIFLAARILIQALLQQSAAFTREHGRITETNRSAVLMKWGSPHEQPELRVTFTRKRIWVTRQLRLNDEKGTVTSESFWKEDDRPVQAVDGRMPAVINVREEERDEPVPQKAIESADVEIAVRANPRTLGNANYAGYDDEWKLTYRVANMSTQDVTARMVFPLPAATGLFDAMYLRLDGGDALEQAESWDESLVWTRPMSANSRCAVEIGYRSRGLEHLRYIPKRMSQTGHYRIAMTVHGIPPHALDYPIGSMPPAERLVDIRSEPYTLTWSLDNALTSYDVGVKLPQAKQPAYHIARLLEQAPVGLLLLFLLLALPRLVAGAPVRPGEMALLGAAYVLFYTFMGRLAGLTAGFAAPFTIAAAVLTALAGCFALRRAERRWLGAQDALSFAALAILYPLAVVDAQRTAFWMQLFCVAGLLYLSILMVMRRKKVGERWLPKAPIPSISL